MIPIFILSLFVFPGNLLYTSYNVFGVLLYSLFLIIDTIMICGGGGLSGDKFGEISMDDYVIGALILYMDIIMLFI